MLSLAMDVKQSSTLIHFRVFIAYEDFDALPKLSKTRVPFYQGLDHFKHFLKFRRHDRILVPLDNLGFDCPVGVNERTGEVGNLCLDHITPQDEIKLLRIHGVFKEYGTTKSFKPNFPPQNIEEFPPLELYGPRWQYDYGDPFFLRPNQSAADSGQLNNEGVKSIHVFNLRTGEPITVPMTKVRLHPNYSYSRSLSAPNPGPGSSNLPFYSGELLTVAILGQRNVRLGGRETRSLFCISIDTGITAWVLENQLKPLSQDYMDIHDSNPHWSMFGMDRVETGMGNLGLGNTQVYSHVHNKPFSNSSGGYPYSQRGSSREQDSDGDDAPYDDFDDDDEDDYEFDEARSRPPSPGLAYETRRDSIYSESSTRIQTSRSNRSRQQSASGSGSVIKKRVNVNTLLREGALDPHVANVIRAPPRRASSNQRSTASDQRGRNPNSRNRPSPKYNSSARSPSNFDQGESGSVYGGDELMSEPGASLFGSTFRPPQGHIGFMGRIEDEGTRRAGDDRRAARPGQSTPAELVHRSVFSDDEDVEAMEHLNAEYRPRYPEPRRSPPVGGY